MDRDTKPEKSRRARRPPAQAADALRTLQRPAGNRPQDRRRHLAGPRLVFCTRAGTPLLAARVYRHQLRPVITQGAEAMDTIFSQPKNARSA
jgi:hypothetical protein